MPKLTITVSEEELKQLEDSGSDSGMSAHRIAERIVHRGLSATAVYPGRTNRVKAAERARRQLALTRLLEGLEPGQKISRPQLQQFAQQHGVDERTAYRDLQVAEGAVQTEISV